MTANPHSQPIRAAHARGAHILLRRRSSCGRRQARGRCATNLEARQPARHVAHARASWAWRPRCLDRPPRQQHEGSMTKGKGGGGREPVRAAGRSRLLFFETHKTHTTMPAATRLSFHIDACACLCTCASRPMVPMGARARTHMHCEIWPWRARPFPGRRRRHDVAIDVNEVHECPYPAHTTSTTSRNASAYQNALNR